MDDLKLLGLKVRDKITGFSGVVESVCYDLYGCIQAAVKPPVNDKGEIVDGRWFDVSRLDVTDQTRVMPVPGGRFDVDITADATQPSRTASGPAEKPAR